MSRYPAYLELLFVHVWFIGYRIKMAVWTFKCVVCHWIKCGVAVLWGGGRIPYPGVIYSL